MLPNQLKRRLPKPKGTIKIAAAHRSAQPTTRGRKHVNLARLSFWMLCAASSLLCCAPAISQSFAEESTISNERQRRRKDKAVLDLIPMLEMESDAKREDRPLHAAHTSHTGYTVPPCLSRRLKMIIRISVVRPPNLNRPKRGQPTPALRRAVSLWLPFRRCTPKLVLPCLPWPCRDSASTRTMSHPQTAKIRLKSD